MLDNLPILSLITFSPLLGLLVLLFVPKDKGRLLKTVGIVTTLIPLVLSAFLFVGYDRTTDETMQFTEEANWIVAPQQSDDGALSDLSSFSLKFNYKMAVDGLSVALIFLTSLVAAMAAMASVHIKKRW